MIPAPPDPPELDEILWADFPRVELAFDIGANAGQTLGKIIGFAKHVVAFEPWPDSYHYLQEHFGHLWPQIEVQELAVSSRSGTIELLAAPSKIATGQLVSAGVPGMEWSMDAAERGETFTAQAVSIDDWCAPDEVTERLIPGFLKIDVEGHELEVIRGARYVIEEHQPHMLIEVHSRQLGITLDFLLSELYDLQLVRHPHYQPDTELWNSHYWLRCFPKQQRY